MYTKQTQKTVKLYEVLIFLLITIFAMILVGLMTRDLESEKLKEIERTESLIQSKLLLVESQKLYFTSTIANSFDAISGACINAVNSIKAEKLKEARNTEAQKLLESPYNLYNHYVDDIVAIYYPSLDPEVIKAVIYHESHYDPNATNSRTGVKGLMQISPKWHTQRALSLGVSDLYDPYGNILVGCDLIDELIEKYGLNYALNVYAGGYPYANAYATSTSPYILEIYDIIDSFRSGAIDREFGGD